MRWNRRSSGGWRACVEQRLAPQASRPGAFRRSAGSIRRAGGGAQLLAGPPMAPRHGDDGGGLTRRSGTRRGNGDRAGRRGAGAPLRLHCGRARSERGDAEFDHLTFTYLLRYVDDPAATLRELARVVKPGGRIACVEFGLPDPPFVWAWRLYTRIGLPGLGRLAGRS